MRLTLDHANAIIAGAFQKAAEDNFKPLCVAVVDGGGHLLSLQRQDGASALRPQIALAKAGAALGMGMSSRAIAAMADERPTFVSSLSALAPQGVVPAAGGIIIVDSEGGFIGAVGISGDTSDNDETCALAGTSAAGLRSQL